MSLQQLNSKESHVVMQRMLSEYNFVYFVSLEIPYDCCCWSSVIQTLEIEFEVIALEWIQIAWNHSLEIEYVE